MIRVLTTAAMLFMSVPALAEDQVVYECTRFKSKCTGVNCDKIYDGLQKDTGRTILSVRKTQQVEYLINTERAVETIKTVLLDDKDRDQSLVIEYKHVMNAYGRITLSNQDSKKIVKEHAIIDTATGLYSFYLLHTDGSIKDVPIGKPYTAYFGWCENKSAPGAVLPDMTPQAEAVKKPEESAPATATDTSSSVIKP